MVTIEVTQVAEKRMYAEADTNPQVDIEWHTVPFGHKDSYALRVLAQLLSTRTGRLYKGLVLGSQVATSMDAAQDSHKWAGFFDISGEARDGHTPEEVEQGIYAEIDKLKKEEVPAEELQKVKNEFAAGEYRNCSANMPIFINSFKTTAKATGAKSTTPSAKIQAVTAADIKRVANKYFTKENRVVSIFTRKTTAAKPEAAQ